MGNFYWHTQNERGNTLKDEMLSLDKVLSINIATAFLSIEGVRIVKELKDKYKLSKLNIVIYLSPQFSVDKPHKLLENLIEIATVKIVYNSPFHAKVYYLIGQAKNRLIFGSSNLTDGGFRKNIEFDSICDVTKDEEAKLNSFFNYCNGNSRLVDEEIINFYKEQHKVFEAIESNNKKLQSEFNKLEKCDDLFNEDKYDLTNKYFTFEDYETLFTRNSTLETIDINNRRKAIQDKVLIINNIIYKDVKKMNLYHHWRASNITSLIRPCVYNQGKVSWVGIRYGKHEEEIKKLNTGSNRGEELGFQKHSCLQFCINQDDVSISLFHAVKQDAVDRGYLHENIKKLAPKIINEIKKLKDEAYTWYIGDKYFEIDKRDPEEFIEFYKKYDIDGVDSHLTCFIEPDSEVLDDEYELSEFIIGEFNKLIPLYNLVTFRL